MSELYQQQASSPATSKAPQAYSAITGVKGFTALNDSPNDHHKFGQENPKGVAVILFVTFMRYQGQILKKTKHQLRISKFT